MVSDSYLNQTARGGLRIVRTALLSAGHYKCQLQLSIRRSTGSLDGDSIGGGILKAISAVHIRFRWRIEAI